MTRKKVQEGDSIPSQLEWHAVSFDSNGVPCDERKGRICLDFTAEQVAAIEDAVNRHTDGSLKNLDTVIQVCAIEDSNVLCFLTDLV